MGICSQVLLNPFRLVSETLSLFKKKIWVIKLIHMNMDKAYTRQDAKAFKGVFCLKIDLANRTDRRTRIRKARIVIIAIIPRSKPKRAIARTFITSKSIFALWKFLGIIFIGKIKVWPYSESCVKSWSEKVPFHSDHMDLYHSGCTHWYQYRTFLSLLNLRLDKKWIC